MTQSETPSASDPTSTHPASDAAAGATVNTDEVAFFARIAESWWDPKGPFKPLHQLNPTRLDYIRQNLCRHFNLPDKGRTPLEGLHILDIGCGGGLVSEPLSRMGATVLGVDASEKNVKTAAHHAGTTGAAATYRHTTAETLAAEGARFDAVINMEVVEHVENVPLFLKSCRTLVKPGGIMLVSTLNRTAKSFLFAVIGAEYVLRWLPKGAHDWQKFMTPLELKSHVQTAGFTPQAATGFVFNPLSGRWRLSHTDTSVNYALAATVPEKA